jgi:pyruvate dehydrogenase E1 component alpha subunit
MLENKICVQQDIDEIEARVKAEIEDAVEFAENSPLPDPSSLFEDNYLQRDYPFIKD